MNILLCLGIIIAGVIPEGLSMDDNSKPSFSRSLSSMHAKADSPLRDSILELIQDYLFGDYDGMNNQPLPRHSLEIEKRSDYPGRTGRILFPGPVVDDIPAVDHLLANTAGREYPRVRHVRRPVSSFGRVEPVARVPHPSPTTFQLDQRSNSGGMREQRFMRMERISKPMVFSKISESSRNLEEQKEKLDNLGVMPQFKEFSRNFQELKDKHLNRAEDEASVVPRFDRKLEGAPSSSISSLETKKDHSVSGSAQRLPKSLPPATIRSQPLIIKDARNGRSMKQIEVQGVKIIVGSRTPDFPKDDLITWRNNKIVNNNVEFDDTPSSWRSSRGLQGMGANKDSNSTPGDSSQGTRGSNSNERGILTVKKTLLI